MIEIIVDSVTGGALLIQFILLIIQTKYPLFKNIKTKKHSDFFTPISAESVLDEDDCPICFEPLKPVVNSKQKPLLLKK